MAAIESDTSHDIRSLKVVEGGADELIAISVLGEEIARFCGIQGVRRFGIRDHRIPNH